MARRVLLLTALMRQPRLIIADEPTPGMDLALAKQAMQDFRTFADDGNGVLLITHDLELALEVADRIVVFYAGTTVEEAKVADFADENACRCGTHIRERCMRRCRGAGLRHCPEHSLT